MDVKDATENIEHIEHMRPWIALVFSLLLGTNVLWFSFYKTVEFNIVAQEQRITRLQRLVSQLISANKNAVKIERIEHQVDVIDHRLSDLSRALQDK